MSSIRVCWVQEAGELAEWGFVLAEALRERDIDVEFALKLRGTVPQAEAAGFPAHLLSPSCYHGPPLSKKELVALDRTYGSPGLGAIARSNTQFDWLDLPMENRIQIVARHYRYWETHLDKAPLDYVFFKTLGTVETRTLYNVARRRGVPYFQFSIGPTPNTFTMNDVGEALSWQELLDALRLGSRSLTSSEEAFVFAQLPGLSSEPDVAEMLTPNTRWAPEGLPSLANHFGRVLRQSLGRSRPARLWLEDPVQVAVERQILRLRREQLAWKHLTSRFFAYDMPRLDEPFVYLPLFHYYEGTTLATCPYWSANALSLIEHCASLLPAGFKLYVKEHPIHLGQRSRRELKRLQQHQRIRVIDPRAPGTQLTVASQAVVVVEGTTGWEALLNSKPLVTLGTRFYTTCPMVYRVDNINSLENILRKAIEEGDQLYERRRDEWLWFLFCVLSTCGRGALYPVEYPYMVPTDSANMALVAESVDAKVRRVIERG